MGKLIITRNLGGIEGLTLVEPQLFVDRRGFLAEVFNQKEFREQGLETAFVQDNESFSKKGVLRGFHVNIAHPQGKLIHVIFGEIFDVSIDLRKGSPTYKQWYGVKISGENHKILYIPEGFGHGYLAMTDAYIHFKTTTHYYPKDEIGFAWNSKEFHIDWPISDPVQNEKDKNSPEFSDLII